MPETGATYYDRQEVRNAADRERSIFHALPGLLRHAIDNAPRLTERLRGIDPDSITDRARLATIPVLRKAALSELQQSALPFGGLTATPVTRLARVFASPGPIYDPEGARSDYWRFARAMYAAGFRPGDIVHNSFSYHLTPAGSMAEGGARALGCPVIPGGTGQTELQLRVIRDLRPSCYVGTPSFLLILLEKGRAEGLDTSSLQKALVSGEAFPPAARDRLRDEFKVTACQCYASADLGLIAYESSAADGLVVDESIILEIVRPGTGEPVPPGEVGEVVVTAFNPDYPLIRFATGDLSAVMPGESPCGRTNMRIRGWLGRADQSTKVRGMFVHPSQVQDVARRHAEIGRARLAVSHEGGRDRMVLLCEASTRSPALIAAIRETSRAVTGLGAEVELVAPGSLPNDGKVIDDRRAGG
ncbi:MAG TPA: AMP-binding protein [Geminicoccaceae bacterium]|nr:AMP-binding protein [Geminicoccaceae bacterium]